MMITSTLLAALKAVAALAATMVADKVIAVPWWAEALIVAAAVYLTPNVGHTPRRVGRGNTTVTGGPPA